MSPSTSPGAGSLGILGGTFDPIHYGHLDAADAAASALALDEVVFIPAHDPPHKPGDPGAGGAHRLQMIALATADRPSYRVSNIELRRNGPSYTIDTLTALHAEGWTKSQLFFIIGSDAFADIAKWRAYPQVLDAATFVVIARPGTSLQQAIDRAPETRDRVQLVEAATRDVSSTQIRSRLAARQPIDDLVPAAVARYIHANHLYGAVDRLHGQDQTAVR